jgi:hypothetical protein
VPGKDEAYAINVPDTIKPYLGGENDPGLAALQGYARKSGWDQGRFDDTLGFLEHCAGEGLLGEAFDPGRELAALGDNGKARMAEQETFLTSVKERGEIDDAEFGELMSLTATAKGVTALEKIRKMMGPAGVAPKAPGGEGGLVGDKASQQAEARQMAADPRYGKDPAFTREADGKWKLAFSST